MKTKIVLLSFALAGALGFAADRPTTTLTADAAVFLQPDGKSPVIARFKAGTTVPLAQADAPAGWRAVAVPGPFEAYIQNKYVGKDLDVKLGTSLHTAPFTTAPSYGLMTKEDKAELVGLRGDWSQVKLEKIVVGYIAVGDVANLPATASLPASAGPTVPAFSTEPGRPVASGSLTPDTPRMFQGRLISARRPILNPHPIYDYQLSDSEGRRFAYVDTRHLMPVGKIENYLGRLVAIRGTMRNTVDGTDLVIDAESIEVK
ncbi:MAG: hypothetical protein PHQ04_06835 [Opitutaceae bacterium]|nr:hypothetical protein [Opitutaceae bacterium]